MSLDKEKSRKIIPTIVGSMLAGVILTLLIGYLAINPLFNAYLMEHPQTIIDSVQKYEIDQRQEFAERAISFSYRALYEDENSPVGGNPDGDVTLVEFFDYQCGFCKQALPDMAELMEDKGLKVIYKEYPILGPESVIAARAALASDRQGKYLPYHHALMAFEGKLTDQAIMDIASGVGLDIERLMQDMNHPLVLQALQDNLLLASNLEVSATPTFVINNEIVAGAVGVEALRERISKAR